MEEAEVADLHIGAYLQVGCISSPIRQANEMVDEITSGGSSLREAQWSDEFSGEMTPLQRHTENKMLKGLKTCGFE